MQGMINASNLMLHVRAHQTHDLDVVGLWLLNTVPVSLANLIVIGMAGKAIDVRFKCPIVDSAEHTSWTWPLRRGRRVRCAAIEGASPS